MPRPKRQPIQADIKCKQHPKYKAILKPRCACAFCWYMWGVAEEERRVSLRG